MTGHISAAAGSRAVDSPEPGHFEIRVVKNGPWMPAIIFRACPIDPEFGHPTERSRPLLCKVGDEWGDPIRVWSYGKPITPGEYQYRMRYLAWAKEWKPGDPVCNPRQPVSAIETEIAFA